MNVLRTFDDVGVRDDVAVGINNHPRPDGVLADDETGLGLISFFEWAVASDQHLDHAGGDFSYQVFNLRIELPEYWGRFSRGSRGQHVAGLGFRCFTNWLLCPGAIRH